MKHLSKTKSTAFALLAIMALSACSTGMSASMPMPHKTETSATMCKKDGGCCCKEMTSCCNMSKAQCSTTKKDGGGCCSGMMDKSCCAGM